MIRVVGGLYRIVSETEWGYFGVKIGQLCILVKDDGSSQLRFYNQNWSYGGCVWIDLSYVEFVGVMN